MRIRARPSIGADGSMTTPSGWPAVIADPAFVPGQSRGMAESLATLQPALGPAAGLTLAGERALPGGSVEIVYTAG